MHPYRIPYVPSQESPAAAAVDGSRIAFGVLAFVGAVQVASAVPSPGTPTAQTVLGATCFVAGVVWLLRHRGAGEPRPG